MLLYLTCKFMVICSYLVVSRLYYKLVVWFMDRKLLKNNEMKYNSAV